MTVLRMVSLAKRNGSDNWYYRRTIPADVRRILEKATKKARRPGWYQTHISISTGTPDRAAAKTAGAEIAANVEGQFKALQDGPKALTAKQVSTLSGIAYRLCRGTGGQSGLTSQQWLHVADANDLARRGEFGLGARLGIFKNEDDRRDASMEYRFGGIVDCTLTHQGVFTDDESRWKVIEAIARDLTEAAKKLARNADGDYSPDTYVNRFPQPSELRASSQNGRKLTGLAEAWHKAALDRNVRPRDAKRWKAVVLRYQKWLGHDDLSRVTSEKVQAWGDVSIGVGLDHVFDFRTDVIQSQWPAHGEMP